MFIAFFINIQICLGFLRTNIDKTRNQGEPNIKFRHASKIKFTK